jgi:hypothetical protein
MITHQAFCGTLLAGERKSDRPYVCAIVQHGFDADIYTAMIRRQFYTAGVPDSIKYFRGVLATPVGQRHLQRGYPVTERDHASAADYLGGLADEAILARELARRLADAAEYVAKVEGKPQVLSWHMSADNGNKALAAARQKSWLRCWALTLVPTSTKPVKAKKPQADAPASVG